MPVLQNDIQLPGDFSLPPGLRLGAATSAYQIEGAATADGKGPGLWDDFCSQPGRILERHDGRIACDHYRRWSEDVRIMRRLGLQAYRFSISWPRVMPTGRRPVNPRGLDFYDRLVDALCAAEIEPCVTLYHWDLPSALQQSLGGWAEPDIAAVFADYAEAVHRRLGDRVRRWITINEPWVVATEGYVHGTHPPGLRNPRLAFVVAHNLLRAHAHAAQRLRANAPGGAAIGLALNATYAFPASDTAEDAAAAERAMLAFAGWFAEPLFAGDYPATMRARLGPNLPAFSAEDARLLRKCVDFLGLNYYFSDVARHDSASGPMQVATAPVPSDQITAMGWPVAPQGLYLLLRWLTARYGPVPICVTENGAAFDDIADEAGFVDDAARIAYLRDHLSAVALAVQDGVQVPAYFAWSLLDNFEWSLGFSKRFGLVRCDFGTLNRTIKASGHWFSNVIATRRVGPGVASGVFR